MQLRGVEELLEVHHLISYCPVLSIVQIFINTHHYLIDSVIWRFRDPQVIKRLSKNQLLKQYELQPADTAEMG